MSIKFPQLHIAESVMNRIQNTLEDIEPLFPSLQPAPIVPGANNAALGQKIESETDTPVSAVEISEDPAQAGAALESVQGGSPFAGMLGGIFG